MAKTFTRRETVLVGIPLMVGAFLAGFSIDHVSLIKSYFGISKEEQPMSDHDRTVAILQRWAHMGAKKPRSADPLAMLWSPNEALAFWPDACQLLTSDVQTAFPERPGLAKGDLRVKDFNDPKNPGGKLKTVDDLATLVLASPAQ